MYYETRTKFNYGDSDFLSNDQSALDLGRGFEPR